MNEEKKCKNCKFYRTDVCQVPLWVEGQLYGGSVTEPEKTCALFEMSDTLVTMEMAK